MSSGAADAEIGAVDDWRLQSIKVVGDLDQSKEYTLSIQCVMAKSHTLIIEEKLEKLHNCLMLSLGPERRSFVLSDSAELKIELTREGFFSKKDKLKESVGTLLRDSRPQADGFREVWRTTQKSTRLQMVFGLKREQDSIDVKRLLKETREMIEAVTPGQNPKLRQIGDLLPVALDAAEIVGQVVPVVNIVVASLRLVLKVVAKLRDMSDQINELIASIAEIMPFIEMAASSGPRRQPLTETLSEMDATIKRSCKVASEYLSESKTKRILASITGVSLKSSEELQTLSQLFKKLAEKFDRAIRLDTRAEVYELSKQRADDILAFLSPTELSSCDNANLPSCMPGTRARLLKALKSWSHSGGPSVYWLYGMAGMGKTAVGTSFCKALQEEKVLAASFFCTQDTKDARSILPTLAYRFALQWPPYHAALAGALERLADVKRVAVMAPADQLKLLFIDRLNSVVHEPPQPFTFVVDGLDQISGLTTERIFDTLVPLLFQLAECKKWIKIVVTIRSELSAKTITANSWNMVARVHNIRDEYDTHDDIRKYLAESLRKSEDPAWPDDHQISELARRANGLFIWAQTVNLYLEDSLAKASDLDDIITSDSAGDEIEALYGLYARICVASIDRDHGRKNLDRFVAAMGAILATSSLSPIPVSLLEKILRAGNVSAEVLERLIQKLAAVMFIDSGEVVSVYHSSFSDFLLDRKWSGEYHVNIEAAHARVSSACLSLINEYLDAMRDRDGTFEVSELLDYCSRYWCKHLELSGESEMPEAGASMRGIIEKFMSDADDRRVKWWLAALDQAGLALEAPWLLTVVKRKFPPLEKRLQHCILVAFENVTGYVPSHSYLDLRDDQFCMEGTRAAILDDIHSWCGRRVAESVFWLYSNGGLGKTAVAASLCKRLNADGSLAGAYFCNVDDPLLSQDCLPALAWSLMKACDPFAVAVTDVLRKMGACTQSDAEELILQAFDNIKYVPGAHPKSMTYIVDALDECDPQSTLLRSRVTHVIDELTSKDIPWLKFVITARPEAEVEALVSQIDSSRIVKRDLSQERDTDVDLLAFCRSSMKQVTEAHRLSLDWPGMERIQKVVQHAQGSFLWIQMLYNFLLCSSNPEDLLQRALISAPGDRSEDYKRLYALLDELQQYHTVTPQGSNQIAEGRRLGFARKITRGLTEVPLSLGASEREFEYGELEVLAPTDVQPKYRALHEGVRIASYKATRVMVRRMRWHTWSEGYMSDDEDEDEDGVMHPKMVDLLFWAHYRHPNIQSLRAFIPGQMEHSAVQDVCVVYPYPDRLLGNLYEVLSQDLVVNWKTFPLQITKGLAYLYNQASSHHGSLSVFHILVDENSNLQITHPQFPSEKAANWNHKPVDAEPRTRMGDVYVWATVTLLVYIKYNFPQPKHLWKAYNPWYDSEIDYGKGMDRELYELVKRCQAKDPHKRPLIGEVVGLLERKAADGKV